MLAITPMVREDLDHEHRRPICGSNINREREGQKEKGRTTGKGKGRARGGQGEGRGKAREKGDPVMYGSRSNSENVLTAKFSAFRLQ